ncbi:hypothetical protein FPV67DRAFT_94884 [Lyophyllum atratum]|nr:hypothetical protein FPV67DRAFT_94884 [Lyophyllum atratum]
MHTHSATQKTTLLFMFYFVPPANLQRRPARGDASCPVEVRVGKYSYHPSWNTYQFHWRVQMLGTPSTTNSLAVGDYIHIVSQYSSSSFGLDDLADLHGRITGFSATNSVYTVSFTVKTEEDETVVLDVPYHYASLSAEDFLTHSSRITTPHHEFDVDLHKRVEAMIRKGRERDASSPHKAPAKRIRR